MDTSSNSKSWLDGIKCNPSYYCFTCGNGKGKYWIKKTNNKVLTMSDYERGAFDRLFEDSCKFGQSDEYNAGYSDTYAGEAKLDNETENQNAY